MKVVIDTNIIINGASDENSVGFKIIKEIIGGRILAYATHQTMSENRHMLRNLVRDKEYNILLEDFFRKLNIVKVYKPIRIVSDPEDNKLVESAAASSADYLITSDREVLAVAEYGVTQIVTPQEFWAKYTAESEDSSSSWDDWSKMLLGGQ